MWTLDYSVRVKQFDFLLLSPPRLLNKIGELDLVAAIFVHKRPLILVITK